VPQRPGQPVLDLPRSPQPYDGKRRVPFDAPDDAGHHHRPRQIEEDQKIGALGEPFADGGILPFGRPSRLGGEPCDVLHKCRLGRPVRAVMQRIELDIAQFEGRSEVVREGRLARPRGARDQDPRGPILMDTPYRVPEPLRAWLDVVAQPAGATVTQGAATHHRSGAFDRWEDDPTSRITP
jgi:hypothetical protein